MQVSEKLVELLQDFNSTNIKSNFLMSDLKQILHATTHNLDNMYWHKPLSNDIKKLANEWQSKTFSEDLYLILNDNLKQIIENDTTNYSAQMIFPIFVNKKLDGFAFFFKTSGNYTLNSSESSQAAKDFIHNVLNKETDF